MAVFQEFLNMTLELDLKLDLKLKSTWSFSTNRIARYWYKLEWV